MISAADHFANVGKMISKATSDHNGKKIKICRYGIAEKGEA